LPLSLGGSATDIPSPNQTGLAGTWIGVWHVAEIDPLFVSIDEAAFLTAESVWTVKDLLRRGVYLAKKSGRRTLVVYASVKARANSLPDATYAKPRRSSPTKR
jgi:hypothetical protein